MHPIPPGGIGPQAIPRGFRGPLPGCSGIEAPKTAPKTVPETGPTDALGKTCWERPLGQLPGCPGRPRSTQNEPERPPRGGPRWAVTVPMEPAARPASAPSIRAEAKQDTSQATEAAAMQYRSSWEVAVEQQRVSDRSRPPYGIARHGRLQAQATGQESYPTSTVSNTADGPVARLKSEEIITVAASVGVPVLEYVAAGATGTRMGPPGLPLRGGGSAVEWWGSPP